MVTKYGVIHFLQEKCYHEANDMAKEVMINGYDFREIYSRQAHCIEDLGGQEVVYLVKT